MVICNSGPKNKINNFFNLDTNQQKCFSHYFQQQFCFRAKDNQKDCIQNTRIILTLLRLHHTKKNTGMWYFTPPNTKIHRKTSGFLMFSGEIESKQNSTKGTQICLKIFLNILESFFNILLAILYLFWASILYLIVWKSKDDSVSLKIKVKYC